MEDGGRQKGRRDGGIEKETKGKRKKGKEGMTLTYFGSHCIVPFRRRSICLHCFSKDIWPNIGDSMQGYLAVFFQKLYQFKEFTGSERVGDSDS